MQVCLCRGFVHVSAGISRLKRVLDPPGSGITDDCESIEMDFERQTPDLCKFGLLLLSHLSSPVNMLKILYVSVQNELKVQPN